jgi:hypothetical protein
VDWEAEQLADIERLWKELVPAVGQPRFYRAMLAIATAFGYSNRYVVQTFAGVVRDLKEAETCDTH